MNSSNNSSGPRKLVEFNTIEKLVDSKHVLLDQTLQIPVLDRLRLQLTFHPTITMEESKAIENALAKIGLKTSYKYFHKKKEHDIDTQIVFSMLNNCSLQLKVYIDGNGHQIMAQQMGLKLGTDMDGFSNVLQDPNDYSDNTLLARQVRYILSQISNLLSRIKEPLARCNVSFLNWNIKISSLEYCYQQEKPNALMSLQLNDLLSSARSLYKKVGIAPVKENRSGKGFLADVTADELKFKCYQKQLDSYRIEYTLYNQQQNKISLSPDDTWAQLCELIFTKASDTQQHLKKLLAFDRHYVELPFEAALKAFQQSCSKNAFLHLYERLKTGDGDIRVKASDKLVYRNLKMLLVRGILEKGFHQSEYFLTSPYRRLISEHSTLNNFINQTNEGEKYVPEANY